MFTSAEPLVCASAELLVLHLEYVLRGFWLTLLPDEQSLHQRSTAQSEEKLLKLGPSVLTYSKSLRVKQLRFVLLSVLMIFIIEKKHSTFAVENGKHISSSLTNKMLGQCIESGVVNN